MEFLFDGAGGGSPTVLLAHGAGAPMDSAFMTRIAAELAEQGLCVARFEFAYMAGRRIGGARRPPPKAENLCDEFLSAVDALPAPGPLIIGGKSLGGRVASLVADDLFAARRVSGLLCLGYPFHPPGRPDKLRTAHLETIRTPTLICQGTRDPFGTRPEVMEYLLSGTVEIAWVEDGDHDLKPRMSVTRENHEVAIKRIASRGGRGFERLRRVDNWRGHAPGGRNLEEHGRDATGAGRGDSRPTCPRSPGRAPRW